MADCDGALQEIVARIDEATERLWDLAAIMNESGARAGAVSQQMSDLTQVAEDRRAAAGHHRQAARQVIDAVEAVAEGIGAGVSLARRTKAHVDAAAEANRRLDRAAERLPGAGPRTGRGRRPAPAVTPPGHAPAQAPKRRRGPGPPGTGPSLCLFGRHQIQPFFDATIAASTRFFTPMRLRASARYPFTVFSLRNIRSAISRLV